VSLAGFCSSPLLFASQLSAFLLSTPKHRQVPTAALRPHFSHQPYHHHHGDCWRSYFCVQFSGFTQASLTRMRSNQTLERTADRREDLLSMISKLNAEAQLALVSGRSALSR